MSGYQSDGKCPNCGKDCEIYTDTKPFLFTTYRCVECGLYINPIVGYLSLEQLNQYRDEMDDGEGTCLPLETLPKQIFKY